MAQQLDFENDTADSNGPDVATLFGLAKNIGDAPILLQRGTRTRDVVSSATRRRLANEDAFSEATSTASTTVGGYLASLYQMSPPQVAELQGKLAAGGFVDPRKLQVGFPDEDTRNALKTALLIAARTGGTRTLDEVLAGGANAPAAGTGRQKGPSAEAIRGATDDIRTLSQQMGLNVAEKRIAQVARQAATFGWSQATIRSVLADEFHGGATAGEAGALFSKFKTAAAHDYLVPLSDQSVNQWVHDALAGKVSEDNFDAYLREQAKSLFPTLAPALDQGVTVRQYVEPYAQVAAQLLGVPPQQIDFLQPKWQRAINQVDPKTGQRSAMSLADWQVALKTDDTYGYDNTPGAKQEAAQFEQQLLQRFGRV